MKSIWEQLIEFGLPGKGSPTGCALYANALFDKLSPQGVSCAVIEFHWKGEADYNRGTEDNHAIFVYLDETGRMFSTDATAARVTWLPSRLSLDQIPQWINRDSECSDVRVVRTNMTPAPESPDTLP